MPFVVGDPVVLTNTFTIAGVATDPTTVALKVVEPDATTTTYTYAGATVTRTATGVYTKTITVDQAGIWQYVWTGTGTAADVEPGYFLVEADGRSLPEWSAPGAGHTLAQWVDKVRSILRDTEGVDLTAPQVETVGVRPALARYSTDRPYETTIEVAGDGSAYFDLPTGWLIGFSRVLSIEYPANQNPPAYLDSGTYELVRKPADASVRQILLDEAPAVGQEVRFNFTLPWPTPTDTAGDDKVDDVAFEAVAHLAAALCCDHLASEAARDRAGVLASTLVIGRDRADALRDQADQLRGVYESFVALTSDPVETETVSAPTPLYSFPDAVPSPFDWGRG